MYRILSNSGYDPEGHGHKTRPELAKEKVTEKSREPEGGMEKRRAGGTAKRDYSYDRGFGTETQ